MWVQKRFSEDIIDYLKWRGDIKITAEHPINEVDYMIFSRFSYFPFKHIALAPRETVKSFSEKMVKVKPIYYNQPNDRILAESVGKSPRFQKIITTDYVNHRDHNTENQFGAVTIHLPNNELCISYIGTDSTLIGWKEDFNMTFMPTIPAQEQAAFYLERIAAKYPNHKLRICGHSKGGNVAVFAALSASTEIQERIIDVINFDGPGFIPDFVNVKFHRSANMLAKVHNYIPQGSMIGRLLQQDGDRQVAYSREEGLFQHDIYSWQIEGTKIVRAKKTDDSSEIFNSTIIDLLKSRSLEERKNFVNAVYDIISSADFSSIDELYKTWMKKLPNFIKKYREITPEDRELIVDVVKQIVTLYSGTRKQYIDEQRQDKKTKKARRNKLRRTR